MAWVGTGIVSCRSWSRPGTKRSPSTSRERTSELAVLKTLGYSSGLVLALVLGESLLLAAVGGGVGLAFGWLLTSFGDPTGGFLPIFFMPPRDVAVGVVLVIALGVAAGALPAVQAMRLRIVDALRRA